MYKSRASIEKKTKEVEKICNVELKKKKNMRREEKRKGRLSHYRKRRWWRK